jgi:acetyl-CoA carboxylase biotin carboxyl carrier protein
MAKYRDLSNANVSGSGNAEELGELIDALLPVLVDRLAVTGLGEIEVERNGATVRVRSEALGVAGSATSAAASSGASSRLVAGKASLAPVSERSADGVRKHAVRATAVGFLTLAKEIHVGAKVAKGALVAQVEVLGIPTEVRALHSGIVVTLRAATGDPVEYGQEIFILESIGEVPK